MFGLTNPFRKKTLPYLPKMIVAPPAKDHDCVAHRMLMRLSAVVGTEHYFVEFFPDQVDQVADRLGAMAADDRFAMTYPAARKLVGAIRQVRWAFPFTLRVTLFVECPGGAAMVTRK